MAQELITMSSLELSRHQVISKIFDKKINGTEAARQLNLSVRQIKRLKVKVKKYGARGLIHGNRGKSSNRKLSNVIIKRAKYFLNKYYPDFGPTFASEKLLENHRLKISSEKVRRIMIEAELWKPRSKKKNQEHRNWRPRKECFGEMQQFDGSYHNWFENRAPKCCLLASIDDATGKITQARFDSNEGVVPVFKFWKRYVKALGKPINIYLDRYSTYKNNFRHLLDDAKILTQFQRAMQDLDINVIHAQSCQAKGRIEKLFHTLQDRLVKELRLENISTIKEANEFLEKVFIPKFNSKFSVMPSKNKDLHKSLTKIDQGNLDKIFSIQDQRQVNNDFTISYQSKWYQLNEAQPTLVCRQDKVQVAKDLTENISVSLRGKQLNFQSLPERPRKVIMKVTALTKIKTAWKPPVNHPWRRPFLFSSKKRFNN